jgi:hypothetical protein
MNPSRPPAALIGCAALCILAACGGGGGSSSTPPASGGPPPAGTTPAPTATPAPSPTPSALVDKNYTVSAQPGPTVNGAQSWYTAGVTVSWTPTPGTPGQNGDTSAGATATSGFAAVDGMACTPTQEPAASTSTYSTHAFVGIYYNGSEYALPQAIGMKNPTEPIASGHPDDNYEVEAESCEYNVHTHDYSGLVHIEDVNYAQSTANTSPLPYAPTLQSLLDIWGAQLGSSGLTVMGQPALSGSVTIYAGTPGSDAGPHGAPVTDSYTIAPAASAVSLGFHQTVWIVIGNLPKLPDGTVGLPQVEWRVEY